MTTSGSPSKPVMDSVSIPIAYHCMSTRHPSRTFSPLGLPMSAERQNRILPGCREPDVQVVPRLGALPPVGNTVNRGALPLSLPPAFNRWHTQWMMTKANFFPLI